MSVFSAKRMNRRIRFVPMVLPEQAPSPRWLGKALIWSLAYLFLGIIAFLVVVAYCAGIYACFILARKTFSGGWDQIVDVEAAKTFFPSLIAVVGAPLLTWRIVTSQLQATAAQHQALIARQAHYTDLFTKAVEQLAAVRPPDADKATGSAPNLEARLGAIFTLERIAQQSDQDYWPVMEVLCAYLRSKDNTGPFSAVGKNQDIHDWIDKVPPPRIDIQAALTVIGRISNRRPVRSGRYDRRFDLTGAILQRASFEGVFLNVDLSEAHLENARFPDAKLNKVTFVGSNLQHARFFGAKIRATSFQHVNLSESQLRNAELNDVFFWDVEMVNADLESTVFNNVTMNEVSLKGVRLFDADLSGVEFEDADFLAGSLGDESTTIPSKANRPTTWPRYKLEDEEKYRWIRQPNEPPKA
jgi:hypothetical protein